MEPLRTSFHAVMPALEVLSTGHAHAVECVASCDVHDTSGTIARRGLYLSTSVSNTMPKSAPAAVVA